MTRTPLLIAIALATTGCDSGPSLLDREAVALGPLTFEVPTSWSRSDTPQRGVLTAQWTPADNERHESLVVIRSEQSPAVAKADMSTVQRFLVDAQRSLTAPRASEITPLITKSGFSGARVDVDFRPASATSTYRRTHVVLVEGNGDALVHVLYTAQRPDPARVALEGVLDTIRREEL